MVGKSDNDTVTVVTVGPFGETTQERLAEATRRLEVLVALHRDGMAVPLPIFVESSYAWQAAEPDRRYSETGGKWEPGWFSEGEREEPAHRMLFGDLISVADLADSEFPLYAERLWAPILGASTEKTE
jgi:exonuclease V gamma subunit